MSRYTQSGPNASADPAQTTGLQTDVVAVFSLVMMTAVLLLVSSPAVARDLFKPDAFAQYTGNAENGKYLFNAAGCASCHAPGDNPELLSGGLKMDSYIGTVYTPNISAHSNGIGQWSNADFLNAMIHGVSPNGRHYYPLFPYTSYAGMKPEDVIDIKAYIDSLPPSDNRVPEHEVSFPYNLNATMAFWKRSNFDTPAWQPTTDSQLDRGRYLVESVSACGSCHTPRTLTYGLDESAGLTGNLSLTGSYAPATDASVLNALADPSTFTEQFLVSGKKLNGAAIADSIKQRYLKGTAELSEQDRNAVFAYISGRKYEPKEPDLVTAACTAETTQAQTGLSGLELAADDFMGKYCRNCHGPGQSYQNSYPAGDIQSIAADANFVSPGNPAKSRLLESITSGRMPIGPRPTAAEIATIENWISSLGQKEIQVATSSAKPAKPERMREVRDRESFVQAALKDLAEVPERDRSHVRYFSFRYQYNGEHPCEDSETFATRLSLYNAGFNKLLNSVSLGPQAYVPLKVAGTNDLLVRVDIRKLEWGDKEWKALTDAYPYAIDPKSDPTLGALARETKTQVPIMRTDWFMANAAKPKIYNVLLRLPENIRELEKRIGVDADKNIDQLQVVRAAFGEGSSGVSDHNRMIERHEMPQGGYYWKSYDFAGSVGKQSLTDFPHGPPDNEPLQESLESFQHDGGEMIFSLPNGLQGYYLSDHLGNRLDEGPEKIVSFRQRPIGKGITIVNGRSCLDCHSDGILSKRDELRKLIETSNRFSLAQQEVLLAMYVKQDELDRYYDKDRKKFVASLRQIDAAEPTGTGDYKSRSAPGNKEIVTWYADLYEAHLDLDKLAAEFDMEAEDFRSAVQRASDPNSQRILLSWILQLDGGSKVPRFEVEKQIARLYPTLLDRKTLTVDNEGAAGESAEATTDKTTVENTLPQYKQEANASPDKLKLFLKVAATDVRVNDRMNFKISANKDCELQALYVESNGNVEEFPQQLLGDANLRAGEPRQIPVKGSGEVVFDEPGHNESLILFCRQGGLGTQRLDKKTALRIAKKSGLPATRGISFKLSKDVAESKGQSAFHMVSFNVKPK